MKLAKLYARTTDTSIVEYAHMELAPPTLSEAYGRCVARGAFRVIIVPYFLAPGRHVSHDIPHMAEDAAKAHPGVPFHITEPLGVDPRIALVLRSRVEAVLDEH